MESPWERWAKPRSCSVQKKFDYAGKPIEYMEDLEAWRIEPAWPKKGEAGIQPIEKYLSRETREQMKDPRAQLLPDDLMPSEVPRSRVRATDDEWFNKSARWLMSVG